MNFLGHVGQEPVWARLDYRDAGQQQQELLNLAYLAVIAGYRLDGCLRPSNSGSVDRSKWPDLEEFLTYLLRYPESIKMPAVQIVGQATAQQIITQPEQQGATALVLASGGIDSSAALLDCLSRGQKPVALWIDYGQPYRVPERAAVSNVCARLGVELSTYEVDLSAEITNGEALYAHIVPARNLLLVMIAALFSPRSITLAGLAEESYVPDKSPRFYAQISQGLGVSVGSPFASLRKSEVLARWRKEWSGLLDPLRTVTCYRASGSCGRCKACFKRAVALLAAGWKVPPTAFETDPFSDSSGFIEGEYMKRWQSFPRERQLDMLVAFGEAEERLPQSVKARYRRELEADGEGIGRHAAKLRDGGR